MHGPLQPSRSDSLPGVVLRAVYMHNLGTAHCPHPVRVAERVHIGVFGGRERKRDRDRKIQMYRDTYITYKCECSFIF